MKLHLRLLGGLQLTREDGTAIQISSRKSRALLAFLATSPYRSCARDAVMAVLWGDFPEEQAQQSLRKELSRLRGSLGDRQSREIWTESDWVHMRPDLLELDVELFRRKAKSVSLADLESARALYAGEFLEGFRLDEEPFEDWLREQRQVFAEEAIGLLARLAGHHAERNDLDRAIAVLGEALRMDPLRDYLLRLMLRYLAAAGRHAGLRASYAAHVARLQAELDVEPEEETIHLFESLSTRVNGHRFPKLLPLPRPAVASDSIAVALESFRNHSEPRGDPTVDNDLAAELARFIGFAVIPADQRSSDLSAAEARYRVCGELRGGGKDQTCLVTLRDSVTGRLAWAGRIARPENGIGDDRERWARRIAAHLAPAITYSEMNRVAQMHESLLQPSELASLAGFLIRNANHAGQAAQQLSGIETAERALAMDDRCSRAISVLSWGHTFRAMMRWSNGTDSLAEARRALDRLMTLEPKSHLSHMRAGWWAYVGGDHETALDSLRHAVSLNPNDPCCLAMLSIVESTGGDAGVAERLARDAIDLNPRHPDGSVLFNALQAALMRQGKLPEAITWGRRALAIAPSDPTVRTVLMACQAAVGQSDRAGPAYVDLERKVPAYLTSLVSGERRIFREDAAHERYVGALERARHAAKRH